MNSSGGREVLINWREYRELVATVTAKLCRTSGHGTLCRLFVSSGWRRDGIGRALVKKGLIELREAGCHRCFVLLPNWEPGGEAQAFFEAMGFAMIPGSEFEPPLGSLVMMREIEQEGEILPFRVGERRAK